MGHSRRWWLQGGCLIVCGRAGELFLLSDAVAQMPLKAKSFFAAFHPMSEAPYWLKLYM